MMAETPLIPMRDFFRNPEKTTFRLSDDGQQLAWLEPWEGRLNIHVQPVAGGEVKRVTSSTERDIRVFGWKGSDRLVWLQDKGGDEDWHLYTVSSEGGEERALTPFPGVRCEMVDDLEGDLDHLLIGLNRRDPQVSDVYRIHLETGELTLVAENPGNIVAWIPDHTGTIRAAFSTDGVNQSYLYRADADSPFATVLTTNFRQNFQPLFFDFNNETLFVSSNLGRDKSAVVRVNPATAEEIELIFEHPEVDVSTLLRSRHRKVITGVVVERDKQEAIFFDDEREKIQRDLEARFPGYEVRVTHFSKDEQRALVVLTGDRTRGIYYLLDRPTGEVRHLIDTSPWLDEDALAPMVPVQFSARDGLPLRGYLTLPLGREAKDLPAVLLVHGGPWARDSWGFHPEVQFLANRGYAVLQVNFRGSTGYGRAFWEASFKQWGKAMQDDLTDGVTWLVEQGIADAKRVAIYGGSYGGYAALAGLAFTPDVYAAGVSFVGPSSLFTLMDSIPAYWEPFRVMLYEQVGHPETEAELVRAASPLFHVDRMAAPLLIAQGARDPRVKQAESDQIVAALQERGLHVPYVLKENEGHGFANEENRFDFYRALEVFLARHLGGAREPAEAVTETLPAGL